MKKNHHLIKGWRGRFVAIVWAVTSIIGAACAPDATVVVSPIFPADEPDLLSAVGVGTIVVTLTPQDGVDAARTYTLSIGERLHLTDVPPGLWTVSLSGRTKGSERIFGRSLPFRIETGAGAQVPVFLGRSSSFNRVALTPNTVANKLENLTGHATAYIQTGEEDSRILVAGGHRPQDDAAATRILLIDPVSLTVEELRTPLSCRRDRPRATVVHHPIHGDVVAITGGEDCEDRIDLFFARDDRLVTHALGCAVTNPGAALAEVDPAGRWPGTSAWPHTGRLIFPGDPSCVVAIEKDSLSVASSEGPHPDLARSTLTHLGNGRHATISQDGALTVFDASGADDSPFIQAFELWEPSPANPRLVSTESGTQLVYLRSSEAGETRWSLVQLSGRSIGAVIDGDPLSTDDLPSQPVPIDVSSLEATMLLFAGGAGPDGSRSRKTSLFYVPGLGGIPTWHELRDEAYGTARPLLRAARAGHTVTALPNRTSWIIGGGATAAEVFVHGAGPVVADEDAAEPLARIRDREFVRRRPTITSLTVHDPLEQDSTGTGSLAANAFKDEYRALLRKADASAVLDLWASASRGVGDGLVERRVPGSRGCLSVKVDFEMPPRGEVFGDLDGIYVDGRWTTPPGGGITQRSYQRAFTFDPSAVYAPARAPEENPPPPKAAMLPPPSEGVEGGFENTNDGFVVGSDAQCTWRQFIRVGFDGLRRDETDRTYAGVHVLVWLARGDDCSQGVIDNGLRYPESDPGSTCVDSVYDDYFGLPPRSDCHKEQLHSMVRDISFDPQDFVVVLVQLPANPQTREATAPLPPRIDFAAAGATKGDPVGLAPAALPGAAYPPGLRRLQKTTEVLEQMRVRVIDGFVDDSGSEDSAETAAAELVAKLDSELRDLDPLQSCIPSSVLSSDPPSILFAEHLGPDGLYLPLHVVSDLSADMARNVFELESTYAADVRRACRIQSLEVVDGSEVPRYRVVGLRDATTEPWRVATDSDRNGACDSGFLVRLPSDVEAHGSAKRVLRCEL